jgi:hypothetical protein
MHAAGFFGMGVNVDRDNFLDVGQLELGHSGFRRLIFGSGKLIILYNKFRKAAEAKQQEQGARHGPSLG